MEKRKPKGIIVDELALAKSAAWAWYNHGSGSDGRPIREFDVSRTKIDPKPTRYKLEAMKKLSNSSTTIISTTRSSTTNSLLDEYEIDSISRQLDHYIESSHAKHHGGDRGGRRAVQVAEIKSQKKKLKGFWFRHATVCGSSRNDVVESRTSLEYLGRRPGNGRVAVAESVGCRPRKGIRILSSGPVGG